MLQEIARQASSLLAQVTMPTDPENPWMWVAGTAAGMMVLLGGTLGTVFWRVLADKDATIKELQDDRKTLTTELAKTTESLRNMTDVVERQRQTFSEGFAQVHIRIGELMDVVAPRRKAP